MLSVKRLRKIYGDGDQRHEVFSGLNLEVKEGELLALLGASGSGKTTLLNLLSGIDTPTSGTVSIDGTDLHALREPARTLLRRQHVGFVFQFFNLIPTLTVGENVALPMELVGMPGKQIAPRVTSLLKQVGLDGAARRYPETLSGGEQQRTAIARALSHRPKLLLADEPTGNLDAETGAGVIDLLTEQADREGTTLLVVTHSHDVAKAADRALRLQQGTLVVA